MEYDINMTTILLITFAGLMIGVPVAFEAVRRLRNRLIRRSCWPGGPK